jgi:hypothetical protein
MLNRARATALAAALDLDVDTVGVCHACLFFVSHSLEGGDEREIDGVVREFAHFLWDEGLAQTARVALEGARERGVPDAEAAVAEVEANGARSPVVRAIVRRLAGDLLARFAARLHTEGNGQARPSAASAS